jgi:hypothetical protein
MIFHISFDEIHCENLEKLAEDKRVYHEIEALIVDSRDKLIERAFKRNARYRSEVPGHREEERNESVEHNGIQKDCDVVHPRFLVNAKHQIQVAH